MWRVHGTYMKILVFLLRHSIGTFCIEYFNLHGNIISYMIDKSNENHIEIMCFKSVSHLLFAFAASLMVFVCLDVYADGLAS